MRVPYLGSMTKNNISPESLAAMRRASDRGRHTQSERKLKAIADYELNPKLCRHCGSVPIAYQYRRVNNFCSQRCAAKFNNAARKDEKPDDIKLCLSCQAPCSAVYCSIKCQNNRKYVDYIASWKSGSLVATSISNHIRRYLLDTYGSKCSLCGWDKVNPITNRVPVEVDHIDGNSGNNKEDNLRLICPNCHSLTPTFRNLNAGNGRKNRRRDTMLELTSDNAKSTTVSTVDFTCGHCSTTLQVPKSFNLKYCSAACSKASRTKKPARDVLVRLAAEMPCADIARHLGVRWATAMKWLESEGLFVPQRKLKKHTHV